MIVTCCRREGTADTPDGVSCILPPAKNTPPCVIIPAPNGTSVDRRLLLQTICNPDWQEPRQGGDQSTFKQRPSSGQSPLMLGPTLEHSSWLHHADMERTTDSVCNTPTQQQEDSLGSLRLTAPA